jgi:recombination protein RecT
VAQFQLGYKGFIQLSQRSGQFQTLNATDVREGEIKEFNRLTGEITFEWSDDRMQKPVIGYVAYFKLLNGFEKSLYMTVEELKNHGDKYSKTFKMKNGLWATDFNAMAMKTVTKLLLAKYAPLSVDMQRAVITDQSVIKDAETLDIDYVDNEEVEVDKEAERIRLMIEDATCIDDLNRLKEHVPASQMDIFDKKMNIFTDI